ncbi:P-loop NTPase fold protein [Streptomyces sp. NPDC001093]|uniref:P-loop NTPase fold protein n=1 Tax=Streptomyces sp. NPDC001093 TaxID=3154376 RepID=UPI003317E901
MPSLSLFSDDPVDGSPSAPDLLGRRSYAREAAALVRSVRTQSDSSVLALIGAWGSGKSSVLTMTMDALREESAETERWLIAEINPWLYPDLESLTSGLFAEIRAALPKDKRWSTARENLGKFAQEVSPLGSLTGLPGVNASGVMKVIGKRIAGETSATATKRKVEAVLREADTPILVVMDDLDRLTPDELLLVFKLVRLIGRLPNVHYLLSYDEHTLLDVLTRSDLVGGEVSRAREFLEKIVQVRLDLPAFREQEALALMNLYVAALLERHDRQLTPTDMSRLGEAYASYLQQRLQTPRSIKRFMGQADASLGSVVGDVDLVDFMLVTFLRTMEPGVYAMIKRHRAELTGTTYTPRHHTQLDGLKLWRDRVQRADVADQHIDSVIGLLGMLFSPVANVLESWQATAAGDAERRHGIGSSDYFDRYTSFRVPDDDLPEATFDRAVQQIVSGQTSDEATALFERLRTDTHRVIRRLEQRLPLAATESEALLALLADEYGHVQGPAEAFGLLRPESAVQHLARRVLADLPSEQRPEALARMAQTPDGGVLAVQTLRNTAYPTEQQTGDLATDANLAAWARTARDVLATHLAHHLLPAAQHGADQLTPVQRELLLAWTMLAPDQAGEWTRERLDNQDWELLALLVRLTPRQLMNGMPLLSPVDLDRFNVLIGLDRIMAQLAPQIDATPPQLPLSTTLATPDLHQQHILSALRRYRDQNPQQPTTP